MIVGIYFTRHCLVDNDFFEATKFPFTNEHTHTRKVGRQHQKQQILSICVEIHFIDNTNQIQLGFQSVECTQYKVFIEFRDLILRSL